MKEALEQIRQTASQLIAAADSEKAVDELRVRFLGKKGELTGILKQMGKLSAEERPVVGALANQVREEIDARIRARMKELADAALAAALAEVPFGSNMRAGADYRRHLAGVLLRRAVLQIEGGEA